MQSLYEGVFRLVPASFYNDILGDKARQDNELVRTQTSPGDSVQITHLKTGQHLRPIGDVTYRDEILTNYYTLCFSSIWDTRLFEDFTGSDACLVIHHPEAVCEMIHFYASKFLGDWIGLDARVIYGGKSDFGAFYLKDKKYELQQEWRFTWIPPESVTQLLPFNIRLGNLEKFAEIKLR